MASSKRISKLTPSDGQLGSIMDDLAPLRLPKRKTLIDLPSLVIEYILSQLNYYDLLQLRLMSHAWNAIVQDYLTKADSNFLYNLSNLQVQWVAVKDQTEDFNQSINSGESPFDMSYKKKMRTIPKMSRRFHHSACYVDDFMYVFGGCISLSTAYNDLWRLDITTKKWQRIIPEGTLPLPRLFPSFTLYETTEESTGERKQYLVLFGGVLIDKKLNTTDRVLSTIHLFDISNNRWTLVKPKGEIDLRSCQHSAVTVGDELIVFSGFRVAQNRDVEPNQVYVFDLKQHLWRLQKTQTPPDVYSSMQRNTFIFQPNWSRRKSSVVSFMLDQHHILYLCDTPTSLNRVSLDAFLLKRSRCEQSCDQCRTSLHQEPSFEQLPWEWIHVELARSNNDLHDIMHGEFCKIGNYLAYLTVKNQVSRKQVDTSVRVREPSSVPVGKQSLRERRIEALDYYSRQFALQRLNGTASGEGNAQYMQKMTLQLRLLDTSHVITEKRLYRMTPKVHSNNDEFSVAPEALACYSLCAAPESLILFGGYLIKSDYDQARVSDRLFFILAKPKVHL